MTPGDTAPTLPRPGAASGYLRRLATTGAAYTAASIVSKLIALALLPLYTRYLTAVDYGAAEVMFAAVVSASIVVRLGMIEAAHMGRLGSFVRRTLNILTTCRCYSGHTNSGANWRLRRAA